MSASDSPDNSDATSEIFDRADLLSSIHGDTELLEQFIQLFLQEFPHKIQILRDAAPAEGGTPPEDASALRDAAHRILGSSRTMRLHRLARAAYDLQRVIDSGTYQAADLTDGTARIIDEYQDAAALLKR
ncbi:MAG: Hpt domain-containing protein [Alkalispirochaeta sp.]